MFAQWGALLCKMDSYSQVVTQRYCGVGPLHGSCRVITLGVMNPIRIPVGPAQIHNCASAESVCLF